MLGITPAHWDGSMTGAQSLSVEVEREVGISDIALPLSVISDADAEPTA